MGWLVQLDLVGLVGRLVGFVVPSSQAQGPSMRQEYRGGLLEVAAWATGASAGGAGDNDAGGLLKTTGLS